MKKKFAGIVLVTGLLLSPLVASAESLLVAPTQSVPPDAGTAGQLGVGNPQDNIWIASFRPNIREGRVLMWDSRGTRANPNRRGPWVTRGSTSTAMIIQPHGRVHAAGEIR